MTYRLFTAMMLMCATPVLAAPTLDQDNFAVFTNAPGNTVGASGVQYRLNQPTTQRWQAQTVVAGLSGQLTSVELQAYQDSGFGDLLVTLGNGELTTAGYSSVGTISVAHAAVASETMIKNGGFTSVDLSAFNYFVTPGQTFTIMLSTVMPAATQQGGNFYLWVFGELDANGNFVNQPIYAPGVNRISQDSGATWGISGADRGFRTYVNVAAAVPEPAVWSLMLVGFAMAGGALRHRRRSKQVA